MTPTSPNECLTVWQLYQLIRGSRPRTEGEQKHLDHCSFCAMLLDRCKTKVAA